LPIVPVSTAPTPVSTTEPLSIATMASVPASVVGLAEGELLEQPGSTSVARSIRRFVFAMAITSSSVVVVVSSTQGAVTAQTPAVELGAQYHV
jgi:hypothetical protein